MSEEDEKKEEIKIKEVDGIECIELEDADIPEFKGRSFKEIFTKMNDTLKEMPWKHDPITGVDYKWIEFNSTLEEEDEDEEEE